MADLHWAKIKEAGSLTGIRILLFTNHYGGRLLFRILLIPVVFFHTLFNRSGYLSSQLYLQKLHAFDKSSPRPSYRNSFTHFWNFSNSLLDKLSVWSGGFTRKDVTLHNSHIIDNLLRDNKGALILISHLGNFEICQALSESRPNMALTVLHHTKNAVKFNTILNKYKQSSITELLQITDLNIGVAMQLGEKIGSGKFIAMAADRVAIDNPSSSQKFSFLGDLAPFPSGPFILGMALQAPIITVFCIKEAGRYNIYFNQLWAGGEVRRKDRSKTLNKIMSTYVERLNTFCLKAPLQWYNFFSFWESDTTKAPSGD